VSLHAACESPLSVCALKGFDELFLQQAKSLEHVAQWKHSGSLLSLRQEGESESSLWVYGDGGLLGGGGRSGGSTEWRSREWRGVARLVVADVATTKATADGWAVVLLCV